MTIQRSDALESQASANKVAFGWFKATTKSGTFFDFTEGLKFSAGTCVIPEDPEVPPDPELTPGYIMALPKGFNGDGGVFGFPYLVDGKYEIQYPRDFYPTGGWIWAYNDSNDPAGGQKASTGSLSITISNEQKDAKGNVQFYSKDGEKILDGSFDLKIQ